MTDNPSEVGKLTPGEIADDAPDNPFETTPIETIGLPPQRIDMRDLPSKLREAIDQRDDREGFRGYAVELANMPEDVPDGWLYVGVYGGGAKAGCTYIDRRYYSERTIEGMEVEIGPAWLNVDNVDDAVRLFLEILRDGGWVD